MGTENGDSLGNGENGHANGKRGSLPQLQGTKRGSITVSTNSTKISRGVNQQHSVRGRKNSEWISDAELQHLKDQFELLDSDGNSSLEREEFILMGRRAGLPLVKMENLFLFLDKNGVRDQPNGLKCSMLRAPAVPCSRQATADTWQMRLSTPIETLRGRADSDSEVFASRTV